MPSPKTQTKCDNNVAKSDRVCHSNCVYTKKEFNTKDVIYKNFGTPPALPKKFQSCKDFNKFFNGCSENFCEKLDPNDRNSIRKCKDLLQNTFSNNSSPSKYIDNVIHEHKTDPQVGMSLLGAALKQLVCNVGASNTDIKNLKPSDQKPHMSESKLELDWWWNNNMGHLRGQNKKEGEIYSTTKITYGISMFIVIILFAKILYNLWNDDSKVNIIWFLIIAIGLAIIFGVIANKDKISPKPKLPTSSTDPNHPEDTDDKTKKTDSSKPLDKSYTSFSKVFPWFLLGVSILGIILGVFTKSNNKIIGGLLMGIITIYICMTLFSYFYAPKVLLFLTFLAIIIEFIFMTVGKEFYKWGIIGSTILTILLMLWVWKESSYDVNNKSLEIIFYYILTFSLIIIISNLKDAFNTSTSHIINITSIASIVIGIILLTFYALIGKKGSSITVFRGFFLFGIVFAILFFVVKKGIEKKGQLTRLTTALDKIKLKSPNEMNSTTTLQYYVDKYINFLNFGFIDSLLDVFNEI